MKPTPRLLRRIALVSALAVAAAYCARSRVTHLACIGDRACAEARAKKLAYACVDAPQRDLTPEHDAYALMEALGRDDCENAHWIAAAIARSRPAISNRDIALDIDEALGAYEGYCHVPFPDLNPRCEHSAPCAVDRARVLVARAEAARAPSSHAARLLASSLKRGDCEGSFEAARALRGKRAEKGDASAETQAIERAVSATEGYCGTAGTAPVPPPPSDAAITLERTACEGSCPCYRVTIRPDGHVTFEGQRDVATVGRDDYTVVVSNARLLFDSFQRLHFSSKGRVYPDAANDGPGYTLALTRDGASDKAVVPSVGVEDLAVSFLADEVDELADTRVRVGGSRDP